MFVSKAKYNALLRQLMLAQLDLLKAEGRFVDLNARWNNLVERINRLGGEEFLRRAKIHPPASPQSAQFTAAEIKALIFLCHPDKHGGSNTASAITAKLLGMRR